MGKQRYKIIEKFECCGKDMVTVMIGNNAHVMEYDDWRKIYGRNHQSRWKNVKVDWNSYTKEDGYKKSIS